MKAIKQVKEKLKANDVIITEANKGNYIVIIYKKDYRTKVQHFIDNSNFHIESTDPTNKFQMEIRKTINLCSLIIPNDKKWKYVNLNLSPPSLKGFPKVHKPDTPICPVVNWRNALVYRLAKLVSEIFKKEIPLPDTFDIKNSVQLMTDLQDIPYNHKIRFASFDISSMYSNVLTTKLPQIISLMCDQLHTTKKFKREITKLIRTLIKQNYFQFQNEIFRQTEGLSYGGSFIFHSFGGVSPIR
jgi:hypothetical protein